jgi:hypothetical protein
VTIIKPGVSGLFNIGSTCYINSALQCLNSVTDFRKRVTNKSNLDNALISALEIVLKSLWTEKGVSKAELETLKSCSGNALDFKVFPNSQFFLTISIIPENIRILMSFYFNYWNMFTFNLIKNINLKIRMRREKIPQ